MTAAIEQTQMNLERRLAQFESELTEIKGNPGNNKVEALSKEFHDFKTFAVEMFSLLRQQISKLKISIDRLETKNRNDSLLLKGLPEKQDENVYQTVVDLIGGKLNIQDFNAQSIRTCYRLGQKQSGTTRSILITFYDCRTRSQIWKNKTKLKGTSVSLSEFLTKSRQLLFTEARRILGVRNCWTQDGCVIIKNKSGVKLKIFDQSDLNSVANSVSETSSTSVPIPGQSVQQQGRQKRTVAKK